MEWDGIGRRDRHSGNRCVHVNDSSYNCRLASVNIDAFLHAVILGRISSASPVCEGREYAERAADGDAQVRCRNSQCASQVLEMAAAAATAAEQCNHLARTQLIISRRRCESQQIEGHDAAASSTKNNSWQHRQGHCRQSERQTCSLLEPELPTAGYSNRKIGRRTQQTPACHDWNPWRQRGLTRLPCIYRVVSLFGLEVITMSLEEGGETERSWAVRRAVIAGENERATATV